MSGWVELQVVATGASRSTPALAAIRATDVALLVGPPGSGKSTILHRLAHGAQATVLLVSAIRLAAEVGAGCDTSLAASVARCLVAQAGGPIGPDEVGGLLRRGAARLAVDGLDEVLSVLERERLAERLADAVASGEVAKLVVSSRPVGLPKALRALPTLRILALTPEQSDALIRMRLGAGGALADPQIASVVSLSAGNPLLASILAEVWRHQPRLPATRSALYASIIDTSLQLAADAGAPLDLPRGDIASARRALSAIALGAFRAQAAEFTFAQARQWATDAVGSDLADHLLWLLVERTIGVLVATAPDSLSFVHVTLWHALVAEAISDDQLAARDILDRPDTAEVLALASGLAADPETVVRLILQRSGTDALRAAWPEIAARGSGVVRRAIEVVTSELGPIIGHELTTTTPLHDPERRTRTLRSWAELEEVADARPEVKGLAFEQFAIAFFGEALTVLTHSLHSDVGQVDLTIANERPDPFWMVYGTDFWVECKFERQAVSIGHINTFIGKVGATNRRLAFFVARSPFSSQARTRIEVQAHNPMAPLVVPIHGAQIAEMLERGEAVDAFIKARVRAVADLRPV